MAAENKYKKRLEALRKMMLQNNLRAYLVPMGDMHGSEYIGEHFQLIKYLTGFTGSAGTLVLTEDEACLWTDGRYFLQAASQLEGSGAVLRKSGTDDPEPEEWLRQQAELYYENCAGTDDENSTDDADGVDNADDADGANKRGIFTVGFDGRVTQCGLCERIEKKNDDKVRIALKGDIDLAGRLWDGDDECERPPISSKDIWELDERYAGRSRQDKLLWLTGLMKEKGAGHMVLSALDDTAWLLNLRGSDIEYNPVFFAFMILSEDKARLYLNTAKPETVSKILAADTAAGEKSGISFEIKKYDEFFRDLLLIPKSSKVWYDKKESSWLIGKSLEGTSQFNPGPLPIKLQKAIKNETEIKNIIRAHIKDGCALTKWIFRMKTLSGVAGDIKDTEKDAAERSINDGADTSTRLTELGAARLLEEYRKKNEGYMGESFAPIVAFGKNGAIVHYEPEEGKDESIIFGRGDFLLSDTGGQYLEGTTDVTRTVCLGTPDEEQKKLYTAVLKGHLRLLDTCFLEGAPGSSLDQLAREPLYKLGIDYRHGTGHGVGYLLNVHEGPNAIRMKFSEENKLYEGMVTSDEPGFYMEGRFGIRIESLVLAVKRQETAYGKFLGFSPLTMAPFDRACIEVSMLSDEDIRVLNDYHGKVFGEISPYLSEDEKKWLKAETAPF